MMTGSVFFNNWKLFSVKAMDGWYSNGKWGTSHLQLLGDLICYEGNWEFHVITQGGVDTKDNGQATALKILTARMHDGNLKGK